MWKTFQYGNEPYIIKLIVKENSLQLCLSNLKILWREEISFKDSLDRFKESNPLLESTEDGIKEQISTMITNISEALRIEMKQNETLVSLSIESYLGSFNVKCEFILFKLPDEIFFREVTAPLIQTIKYLEDSQKFMIELLTKKDRELEEYKLEKGNITREDLVTTPFSTLSLENGAPNSLMLNLYNNSAWSILSEKFGCVKINNEGVTNKASNNGRSVKRRIYSAKTSKKKPIP